MRTNPALVTVVLACVTACADTAPAHLTARMRFQGPDVVGSTFAVVNVYHLAAPAFSDEVLRERVVVPLETLAATIEIPAVDVEEPRVRIVVLYCDDRTCTTSSGAQDFRPTYTLEHPFYPGETTWWDVEVPAPPSEGGAIEPETVQACSIGGCVAASGPVTIFCQASGRHFCDA